MYATLCKTPIMPLRHGVPAGNRLFVKRDDLLPFCFGGNKVRIARCFLDDMVEKGGNLMLAYGNSRSNLCRVLAGMCAAENYPIWIVSPADDDGTVAVSSNRALTLQLGARVIPCRKNAIAATIQSAIAEAERAGYRPYYMNGDIYGKGNEATPVRAYAEAYDEICEQAKTLGIEFDYIFHASGTGMTQAGLICGQILSGNTRPRHIVGISIARDRAAGETHIGRYVSAYLSKNSAADFSGEIELADAYRCGGYGLYDSDVENTIRTVFRYNGIGLDPVYTGKAFHGMVRYIGDNNIDHSNILFLHTGSAPLFFDWLYRGTKDE